MIRHPSSRQNGAVLVVGLIMLMLITLLVGTAYRFSSTNLKSVNNMQSRAEATAAANKAIEQIIASWDSRTALTADQINVDIDNNGSSDYVVDVAAPVCAKVTPVSVPSVSDSECPLNLEGLSSCAPAVASVYNVIWDIDATATGNNGTRVRVRQGLSQSISQNKCDSLCPPAPGTPCV